MEDRTVNQAWVDMIENRKNYFVSEDDASDLWYVEEVPSDWEQAASHEEDYSDVPIKIKDMVGVSYEHNQLIGGKVTQGSDSGSQKWIEFMNQLTWEELCQIASQGAYARPAVESIDKPLEVDLDGPAQLAWVGTVQVEKYYPDEDHSQYPSGMGTLWVTAVVIASTWNDELAEEMGRMAGNESILTNTTGWYGPGLNIHRHPLGGRNYEYYSEDPVLSGKIAASVIYGATSKGTVCYVKHMFLNEQETDRGSLCTYVTEQAIREIYLKPFEYAVKSGRVLGTMAAVNNIGSWRGYGNYALHNTILRGEWNFKGINITDYCDGNACFAYSSMNHLVRNGVDIPLGPGAPIPNHPIYNETYCDYYLDTGEWNAEENMVYIDGEPSPTQYYSVRMAAMHALYVSANSNGIDNAIAASGSEQFQKSISLEGGEAASVTVITPEEIGAVEIMDVAEVVGEDGVSHMPAGMTLSDSGVLSGTPQKAGTYTVSVSMRADGWVQRTLELQIVVGDAISCEGSTAVAAGESFTVQYTSDLYRVGATEIKNDFGGGTILSCMASAVEYSAVGLPEGVTISKEGVLSGSVAQAGVYQFDVTVTASGTIDVYGLYLVPVSVSFTQTFSITVQ